MRKLVLSFLLSASFLTAGYAQTLFTFGGNPVSKEDFIRVYEKNSFNKKADYSDKALKDYLELYSLFRMKVKEAELQHLDTLPNIQHELENYKRQLARNYLTDEQVNNKLIREAYDRMKEEIHVQHILILSPIGADSAIAYKKIDSIYKAVTTKKADFNALAKQYSDDQGSKDNGGDIGYITALQTVYPFENATYNTPVGKVSAPFKTQFGYHIIKVLDRRKTLGEIKVAQILIAVQKSKGEAGIEAGRKRADSVLAQLKSGTPFESLVRTYSDDKFSVNENGVLKPFTAGHMVPAFENAAFALKNPGDYTQQPIQTDYGFHIIKLIEKTPLKPYDTLYSQLKRKVENDSRAQVARNMFMEKIKEKNGYKEYPENLTSFADVMVKLPDTGKNANLFKASDYRQRNATLFVLANKKYTESDFANYMESITHGRLMGPRRAVINDLYKMYTGNILNDFEENRLMEENPEFKNLMEEYRAGIMLFELMDRNVWGKASKDSTGLSEFYESHKNRYTWDPGFSGGVYKFKNETTLKEGLKLLAKKETKDDDVSKAVNTEAIPDGVNIQRGRFEFSRFKDVPQADIMAAKVSKAVRNEDGTYTVVKADKVYNDPTPKTLEEARGYVIAEYQDFLEKKWNEQMRSKYPVKVNQDVYNSIVKN